MTATGTLGNVPDIPLTQPSPLRAKVRALIHEMSKFGTVGAVAFTIDLAIFNVLLQIGVETLAAKTISTVVATNVAFLGNRFWTWRHRVHTHMARQYTMFFVLNAVGLGIGLSCLALSHYALGHFWPLLQSPLADNISAQLIGTGLGTLFRFWSYRRFVFRAVVPTEPHFGIPRVGRRSANVTSPSSPVRDSA